MNGATAPSERMSCIDKWAMINHTIYNEKIAILALQETHLDQHLLEQVNNCFGKNLEIINSELPDNPRSSAGVAFVINKALICPKDLSVTELVPGRAIMLKIKWLESCKTSIVNVYVLHNRNKQPNFWANIITNRCTRRLPLPDFVLGDFNVTEDAINRSPAHQDDQEAIEALREIRREWNILDGWRHTNPATRCFTYHANTNGSHIQSCLDRIYTSQNIAQHIFDWQTKPSSVPTDHWLVKVKFTLCDAPFIRSGRWTWPLYLLEKETLMKKVEERGIQLERDLDRLDLESTDRTKVNPQTLWKACKEDMTSLAKKEMRNNYHKLGSRIKAIEKDLHALLARPDLDTNEDVCSNAAFLTNELEHLEKVKAKNQRNKLKANLANHGERLGSIWSALSKEKKPHNPILRLRIPESNPPQYEHCTKRIVKLARDHHENQQNDNPHPNPEEHRRIIDEILLAVPESQRLPEPDLSPLNWEAQENTVSQALDNAKDGTAAGLDGCPNKLWKRLKIRYDVACKSNGRGFNLLKALTTLIRDIQKHGVDERSNFAEGWMCPLFKKKDPTDIRNYCPITVLNTDYKLLTKVLALQLIEHADMLIHEDQAGFIPRRSIFNHIRLAKAIISYADIVEEDGAIIALDQEKAYDKIHHDYLWKVLETFHIPSPFIRTVKALYSFAYTRVAINGVLSEPYQVMRGVRQGDPLSCLLFDLAIEPLACLIRSNPNIQGINIPGLIKKLVIKLFADNTNLYLSKYDRLDVIQRVLDMWCEASGAKFNIEKTKVIPTGSTNYRQTVATKRKINPQDHTTLPNQIRIAKDSEAVRMLGAWIGNKAEDQAPWEPLIDKIKINLEKWNRIRPSINGKCRIIQAIVGGFTQFLTQVQGMPSQVETALKKIINDFIWDDGKGACIAQEFLHQPKEVGGLDLLDIKARNEAIELMWLKTYLNFSPKRQPWAAITDLIIAGSAQENSITQVIKTPFLQCWEIPSRGPRLTRLNDDIKCMIKAAKDQNTNLAAVKIPAHLRKELPAWYHTDEKLTTIRSRPEKCLIEKYETRLITDLINISARIRNQNVTNIHTPNPFCPCQDCATDQAKGCYNPHECTQAALAKLQNLSPKWNPWGPENPIDGLSLTPSHKANNLQAKINNDEIVFNLSLTCSESLADIFRVLTNPNRLSTTPALCLPPLGHTPIGPKITIFTDGACLKNRKRNATCGGGTWVSHGNPLNASIRVPGPAQSNQIGEIAAVIQAAASIPLSQLLEIVSDSKYVIEGLTNNLNNWEDQGWIGIQNAPFFQRAAYLLRRRMVTTTFRWVKGHDGVEGNEQCDRLAKDGAANPVENEMDLSIPNHFNVQGTKLASLMQSIAYKGILEMKRTLLHPSSSSNIQRAREAIERITRNEETDATIWLSIRKAPIRYKISQFLYKTMHKVFKIGEYWNRIPKVADRSLCATCGTTKSMDHILSHCRSSPNRIIWNLIKSTWPHRNLPWPGNNLGTILGCGCITAQCTIHQNQNPNQNPSNAHLRGTTRLLQILLLESAFLIWVLRCERVIQEKIHSNQEIRS